MGQCEDCRQWLFLKGNEGICQKIEWNRRTKRVDSCSAFHPRKLSNGDATMLISSSCKTEGNTKMKSRLYTLIVQSCKSCPNIEKGFATVKCHGCKNGGKPRVLGGPEFDGTIPDWCPLEERS